MRVSADELLSNKDVPANYTLSELDSVLIKYNIKSSEQLDYILSKINLKNLNDSKIWENATELACETIKNLQQIIGIAKINKDLTKDFFYNSAKIRNFDKSS